MLGFDDPRWGELEGGYRVFYDPRPCLSRLKEDGDDEDAWSEFWNELHHQGDVGRASYAAVPHLVEIFATKRRNWQFYALITTIEVERQRNRNPDMPTWLAGGYERALTRLLGLAAEDIGRNESREFTQSLLGAVAAAKGEHLRAEMVGMFTDGELEEMNRLYDEA